jgi:cbb3-type cytochrome oxidase subunit 3
VSCAGAVPTNASANAASPIVLTMFFMDWLWFELVRDKKTRNGQGREANLLLRTA